MGSDRKEKRSKKRSSSESEDERRDKRQRRDEEDERKSRKKNDDKKEKGKDKKSHKHSSDKDKKSKEKNKNKHHKGDRGPKHGFQELSKDDYFSKNNEFATWLKEETHIFFSDLSSEAARELFADFVKAWNNQKLGSQYYEGIASAPRTAHNWKIKQ